MLQMKGNASNLLGLAVVNLILKPAKNTTFYHEFVTYVIFVAFNDGTTFYVNGVTTLVNASSSQTPRCNKAPINHCSCHCTVNQDSRAINE